MADHRERRRRCHRHLRDRLHTAIDATASGKAGNWEDVPDDKGYAAQRDAIKKHVERLIEDLLKKQP